MSSDKKNQTRHRVIIPKDPLFISMGNIFFRTDSARYAHMGGERAWICWVFFVCFFFFYDERDYRIKDARPCQLSSVWTKAAPSGSTMANTDECLLPRWRCAQLL